LANGVNRKFCEHGGAMKFFFWSCVGLGGGLTVYPKEGRALIGRPTESPPETPEAAPLGPPPPSSLKGDAIMKVKTNVKAGGMQLGNHNEALVRGAVKARGLKVKTGVKAGGLSSNHNEALVRDRR
jgi:hypothetical protein